MCGLAGVLLCPAERTVEQWQGLREAFTQNLVSNEERGREAAGVALVRRDGTYELFKEPVRASELVRAQGYQRIMSLLDGETVSLLGHARLPTKGSPWNNTNNHPLMVGHIVGVHNGMIFNDDELFGTFGFPRLGEVDSEVLFWLLDSVHPLNNDGNYLSLVGRRMEMVQGTFALMAVDLRRPTALVVVRGMMPLCLHYEKSLNALFFSSRYVFLRKLFGDAVMTEFVEPQQVSYFDAGHLLERQDHPFCSVKFALGSWRRRIEEERKEGSRV